MSKDFDELLRLGDEAYASGNAEESLKYYESAYRINSEDRVLLMDLTTACHMKERYEDAIGFAEKGLELFPDEAAFAFNAGLASNSLDENYNAISWYTRAIEIDKDYAIAYYARANCYFFWNDYETALDDYIVAWEHELEQADLPEMLAECLEKTGGYEDAAKFYKIADDTNPGPENRLRLAVCTYIAEGPLSLESSNRLTNAWKESRGNIELEVYMAALMRFMAMDEELAEQEKRLEAFTADWEAGDDSIIKCPDCYQLLVKRNPETEGNRRLERWADGYWEAGEACIPPVTARCPHCGKWHMLEDFPVLFVIPFHDDKKYGMLPIVESYDEYTDRDYLEAIGQSGLEAHELELRMRLWWKQNIKRRHPAEEGDPDLTTGLYENLERIAELSVTGEDFDTGMGIIAGRIIAAEAYRQMGDFERALQILNEGADTEPGRTIKIYCRSRKIQPVHIGERPVPEALSGRYTVNELINSGYYPYPEIEDVFDFPLREKVQEDCFLQVKLSLLNEEWRGWATFFCGERSNRHYCDRLFTDEEWEIYRNLPEEKKEDMLWFWGFKSFEMPQGHENLDRYYRIFYMFYNNIIEVPSAEEIREHHEFFDPAWEKLIKEAEERKKIWKKTSPEWLLENRERCCWFLFWYSFKENTEAPDRDTLLALVNIFREAEEKYTRMREKAMEGIPSLRLGGNPIWWQDYDRTPVNSSGKKMSFIGQVWTDSLNAGLSRLVYIFYDPEEGILEQTFDYD